MADLLQLTDAGLYCEAGGFHIDPWRAVARAVITHAHSDHARSGSGRYLTAAPGRRVLASRLGGAAVIDTLSYGEVLSIDGVRVSLHPAGHILGSAQVRVERAGEVWVAAGDYKLGPDRTCDPFDPQRCHVFISESTFGLPVYRWRPQDEVFAAVNSWWRSVRDEGRNAVLFAYSLGKAQRLLSGLDPAIGPIHCHGAVQRHVDDYRDTGVELPATLPIGADPRAGPRDGVTSPERIRGAMVIAPPSAAGSPWMRRFGDSAAAFASGWMQVRGQRRRQGVERGFVLSDHADWSGLLSAIDATGAGRVMVTHGFTGPLVKYLREVRGLAAEELRTRFEGERPDGDRETAAAGEAGIVPPDAAGLALADVTD